MNINSIFMPATLLFSDNAFTPLARKTRDRMRKKATIVRDAITFSRFGNGEVRIRVGTDVRSKTVVLFKSFLTRIEGKPAYDPNSCYLELFLANDALKRAGARRVIDVIPYIPYLRQDRVAHPGEPISVKLFAEMTYRSGADTVISVDPHSVSILPHYARGRMLTTVSLFADHLKHAVPDMTTCVVIAPDKGAKRRAQAIAKLLDLPLAVCKKRRDARGRIVNLRCDNLPDGKSHAIIYDDIIDSGGTLFRTVDALKQAGLRRFTFCCTHAILSGNALQELRRRKIRLVTTDSIPLSRAGITVISLADLLVKALDEVIR